jgi:ferredoxin/flavodoxin---NADP+ reductase
VELTAAPLKYNATIVERVDVTDALAVFRIEPDEPPAKRPWFTAGQYCVLGLNNTERPRLGSVRRPMSIASPPAAAGPVEFYIRRIAKAPSANPLTHLLWKIAPGGRIYMRTVGAGVFTIKDTVGADDPRVRVLVAAGTGLAPFMSMLRDEVRRNAHADLSKWVLLHGASYPRELGYRRELLTMTAVNRLRYWATVSRPEQAPEWTGDVGRVESFFASTGLTDLESRMGLPADGFTPETSVVYICGLAGTITGTIVPLIDRGFIPDEAPLRAALGVPPEANNSVFSEHYDSEPVINLDDHAVVGPLRARMRKALDKSNARSTPVPA